MVIVFIVYKFEKVSYDVIVALVAMLPDCVARVLNTTQRISIVPAPNTIMSETIPLEIAIGARECEDDDAEKVALEIASAINQEDVLPEDIRFDTVVSLRTKNGKIVSVPVVRRH